MGAKDRVRWRTYSTTITTMCGRGWVAAAAGANAVAVTASNNDEAIMLRCPD